MAINFRSAKPTRHPGVLRLPDGRFLVRAAVRQRDGKILTQRRLLPETATESEAVQAVLDLKEAIKSPTPTPHPLDTCQTVQQYCERWLEVRSGRLSPTTITTYTEAINDRVLPRLGWMACQDVTRQVIEAWVVWVQSAVQPKTRSQVRDGKTIVSPNSRAGQPYTQDTMRKWWRCLKTIMGDMAADLDVKNPVLRVRQPERPELPLVREQRTLDTDRTGDLLAMARTHYPQHFACIATMTMCGMRAGEVFALKWDAVDFEAGTITVRRSVSKREIRETTKTKAKRVVPMHPELIRILKAHREAQVAAQHAGLKTGLLFPTDDGELRLPSNMKKVWPKLAQLIGSDLKVGSQVLRRSLNTNLVMAGVDRITTRAILGHTSEAMTQRYAGIGDQAKAEAVRKLRPVEGE